MLSKPGTSSETNRCNIQKGATPRQRTFGNICRAPLGFVDAIAPETSTSFLERSIMEHKLWEQLHAGLSKYIYPQVPFPDR